MKCEFTFSLGIDLVIHRHMTKGKFVLQLKINCWPVLKHFFTIQRALSYVLEPLLFMLRQVKPFIASPIKWE